MSTQLTIFSGFFFFFFLQNIRNCLLSKLFLFTSLYIATLHFFQQVRMGRGVFFPNQSQTHRIIASLVSNEGLNKSTLQKKIFSYKFFFSFRMQLRYDNNFENIFKRSTFLKEKNGILKIRCNILLYSKNFSAVFINQGRAVADNQTSFFLGPMY